MPTKKWGWRCVAGVIGLVWGHAGAGSAGPVEARSPTTSMRFVAVDEARVQRPSPEAGTFVIDLDRLESPEAGRDLVQSWQRRRAPGAGSTSCWLLGTRREDVLRALGVLTEGPRPACVHLQIAIR